MVTMGEFPAIPHSGVLIVFSENLTDKSVPEAIGRFAVNLKTSASSRHVPNREDDRSSSNREAL
jgi:hypothetical protein